MENKAHFFGRVIAILLTVLFISWAVWSCHAAKLAEKQRAIASEQISTIQQLVADLDALQSENDALSTSVLELQKRNYPPDFKPNDKIPLSVELQEFTYMECLRREVPYGVYMAILENESGFVWPGVVMDANGLPSVGYAQINWPNWEYISEKHGFDVHSEKGNIAAGVAILADAMGRHPLEKALVVYQCGETGAVF